MAIQNGNTEKLEGEVMSVVDPPLGAEESLQGVEPGMAIDLIAIQTEETAIDTRAIPAEAEAPVEAEGEAGEAILDRTTLDHPTKREEEETNACKECC